MKLKIVLLKSDTVKPKTRNRRLETGNWEEGRGAYNEFRKDTEAALC
jgi:hypothetical protein